MPERLEVEIALRDQMSTGLKQIAREIEAVTKRMMESGSTSEHAFEKIRKGSEDAKKHTDNAKTSMSSLSGFLVGLSRTLIGAAGVAAGFYAVSEALENISKKRVALQNLGTDLGFTTEKMSLMQRALARIGLEAGDQNKLITNLGVALKDVFKLQERSSIMTELRSMSEHGFANQLKEMVNAGADLDAHMASLAREWQRLIDAGKPQAAKNFADIFKIPESVFKNIMESTKGLKAGYQIDYEVSKEHLQNVLALEHQVNDVVTFIEEKIMQTYNAAFRLLKSLDWKSLGGTPVTDPLALDPTSALKRKGHKFQWEQEDEGALPPNKSLNSYRGSLMREEDKKTNRLLGEIADTLKIFESTTTRESGGGYTSRGALGGAVASGGGGGGGGGSRIDIPSAPASMPRTPLGPTRFGRPARVHSSTGISQSQPIQTEQPLPTRGSGVMDRSQLAAEMRANPEMARRLQTIVQGEVGHGASDQRKQLQLETIFNRATARGQSLAEVTQEYTGRGSKGYYPRSTFTGGRIRNEEEFRKFQENIMGPVVGGSDVSTDVLGFPATGNASGGVASRGIASGRYQRHGTLGGETYVWQENLKQQQRLLASRGGGGSGGGGVVGDIDASDAVAFMRSRGGHDATTGKETAPNINPELASRLAAAGQAFELETGKKANFGEMGRSKELQAIYYNKYLRGGGIAARPGFSRHQRGEATDIPRGDFLSWLHSGGGKKHGVNFPVRGDPVHAQMDPSFRDTIDRSLQRKATTPNTKGSVKAEVDFSNMPAAQKKSGDELGKFKLLKISPAPQGAKDNEGLMTPGDLAHTPYVP